MFHTRTKVNLEYLIKRQGITKIEIAKTLKITPQWLSKLLSKDAEELTVKQLKDILAAIGLKVSVQIEELVIPDTVNQGLRDEVRKKFGF